MRKRRFLYREFSLLLSTCFFFSPLTCCSNPALWGRSLGEVRRLLEAGDHAFLRQIDWLKENPQDLRLLGEGAGYYLHFIFREQGYPDLADQALKLEWMHGKRPWKEEAGLRRLELLAEGGEYALLEEEARRFAALLPDSAHLARVERLLLTAAYWQDRDEEVLQKLAALPESRYREDPELRLFKAVCSCRRGISGWESMFGALFLQEKRSSLHWRALAFLELDGRLDRFPGPLQALFRAKVLLYQGLFGKAIDLLEEQLPLLPAETLESSTIIEELGLAYLSAGQLERGARFLSGLASRLSAGEQLTALEMAGRLYRKLGELERGEAVLKLVIGRTEDPVQRDRAIWYYLDMRRRAGFATLLPEIARFAPLWQNPAYFADLLNEGATELVEKGDWASLERLYRCIEGSGPDSMLARIAYLLGRGGRYPDPDGLLPRTPRDLLRKARELQPDGYYGLLASALLGEEPPSWSGGAAGGEGGSGDAGFGETGITGGSWAADDPFRPDPGGAPESGEPAAVDRNPPGGGENPAGENPDGESPDGPRPEIVEGFFRFGLPREGYERLLGAAGRFPPSVLRAYARKLSERGWHLESIRLMQRLQERRGRGEPPRPAPRGGDPAPLLDARPTPEELTLLYPRAFGSEIADLAGQIGLDESIFFALVREESHFDPTIVSRAGAVGLTQLMPATARDLARQLKIQEPDLRDPRLNLLLGSRHLKWLMSRLEDLPKVLMAYNAGLSRVRGWERQLGGLPADLFAEAVPYEETRHYLRKILVSAVYYGRLYQGLTPAQTVRRFFPDFP